MRYFPPTCSSLSPSLSLLDRFHRGNSRLALSCLVSLLSLPPPTFSIESLFYTVYVRVPSFPKLMSASWVIRERERKKEFEDDCLNLVQQIYLFPAFIIFSDISSRNIGQTGPNVEQQKPIKIQSLVFASVWKRFPTRARKI